jgi:hypothetical protein
MSWMVLKDGQELSLSYPRPDDISIERIAHQLAQINRFTGAASRPYSVAEHSLLVVELMERGGMTCPHGLMAGLLHDAHEIICNDQSTPSKHEIGPGWTMFEERMQEVVAAAMHTRAAWCKYHRAVKLADMQALAIERDQLVPKVQPNGYASTPWPGLHGIALVSGIDLNEQQRVDRTWNGWRLKFMARFDTLDSHRRAIPMQPTHMLSQGASLV